MREPILPINIVAIIKNFPIKERRSVPPSENPTLLNADVVSKNKSIKFQCGSVIKRQNVVKKIQPMLIEIIAIALYAWSSGICLPIISTQDLPEIAAFMVLIKTAKVEILIPLPVESGEEPIRPIRSIKNNVAI